ncbi:phage lysozyme [Nitrospirillum amazonense]|uniref:Phage lysozyme n=2 Tax=Nitrospirillum amazonense TaxID=28077 RepID=A0A560KAN1_9PROT|nr:phage lysozyme [Nitrospirillum amazonense]
MYLDSEGLVTVGCGTLLATAESASALPFLHKGNNQPASKLEVEAAWRALFIGHQEQKSAAPHKKHTAAHYENDSDLRITQATANTLLDAHLDSDHLHLKLIYPKFDDFPDDAKLALFDMIYNLGAGRSKTRHHRAAGLMAYSTMNHAINSGDWAKAAKCCFRHGIQAERNKVTAALFERCAQAQKGRSV